MLVLALFLLLFPCCAWCSAGDSSLVYQRCLRACVSANCTDPHRVELLAHTLSTAETLLRWSCRDVCAYDCMWEAVEAFVDNGRMVPQFHGKWPFVR